MAGREGSVDICSNRRERSLSRHIENYACYVAKFGRDSMPPRLCIALKESR